MTDTIAESALRKVRWRLIPFLFLLYIVAYLDRVNVGFAAIDMNRALGFTTAIYGLGSGIFFLSYTLLEVPSNLIGAPRRAALWIARIMVRGAAVLAMVFVDSPQLYPRFLPGPRSRIFLASSSLTPVFPSAGTARRSPCCSRPGLAA